MFCKFNYYFFYLPKNKEIEKNESLQGMAIYWISFKLVNLRDRRMRTNFPICKCYIGFACGEFNDMFFTGEWNNFYHEHDYSKPQKFKEQLGVILNERPLWLR